MKYLCYDLKGIQHYIFQVPKLKCCVGGSRQVDNFDRNKAKEAAEGVAGTEYIYSGGGKGAFRCEDGKVSEALRKALVKLAHKDGLTIQFGEADDYSEAARNITHIYCYQPEKLAGQPCSLSGLYPTTEGRHPLMKAREELGRKHDQESPTEKFFLDALRQYRGNGKLRFFYDVSAEDGQDGREAAQALGNRNRWAVVCMDGNDMGKQFLAFRQGHPADADWWKWLPDMSQNLDKVTCQAALQGMKAVADAYLEEHGKSEAADVLPLRPLIVGGDDVTVLVGCDYAMTFVSAVCAAFNRESKKYAEDWVGTAGELTISAGVLFAPVTLPLHSAIDYAEMLLKSAKGKGRDELGGKGGAAPSCADWESVTEGLLDEPGLRRNRELRFKDGENGKIVSLTDRPYLLGEFNTGLMSLKAKIIEEFKLPNTIQYQIQRMLMTPLSSRLAFYARLGKNYPELRDYLREPVPGPAGGTYGDGWQLEKNGQEQKTRFLDALLLLQESNRLEHPTIGQDNDRGGRP